MAVTYFNVAGNYSALAPGLILRGNVLFTPVFRTGDIAKGTGLTPPTGFVGVSVPAKIVGGVLQALDGTTVQLQSNTADLNLTSPLYYAVAFSNMTATEMHPTLAGITSKVEPFEIGSFAFLAPTDATAVNLVSVAPAPGTVSAQGAFTVSVAQITDASAFARGFLTSVTDQASAKTYFGIGTGATLKRPLNNILVGMGASITTWLTIDTSYTPGCFDNFIGHLCVESYQRIRYGGVIGHGGYTQAQIITNYLPTLLAMSPTPGACVYFDGPFNDIATGVTLTQTKANLATVVTALTSAGIVPVLATVPSHYYTAKYVEMAQWNKYIRRYAATHGFPLIDLQAVMQDINGAEITALSSDTVHPNSQGHKLIAQQALSDGLLDIFPPSGTLQTSRWIGDLANLLNDGTNNVGLFNTDTNADGIADGWTLNSGTAAKTSIVAPQAGERLLGNWQQLAFASGDAAIQWSIKFLTTGFSVGDVLAISARVQTENMWTSGSSWTVGIDQYFAGGYTYPAPGSGTGPNPGNVQSGCVGWLSDVDDGLIYAEVPVLASTTSIFAQMQLGGATVSGITAKLRVGEFTIANLTTGALLS